MNESISLSNVWKRYGKTVALADVSFEVKPSEFFVLIGPSGAGKTTTLRVVAGLESPSSGLIRFGDRAMNEIAPQARKARMAFENYSLYPHMAVRDNLATAGDDFYKKLKIDSLQALELLTRLENHFGVELPDYEVQGVTDFGTLVGTIRGRFQAHSDDLPLHKGTA